MAYNEAMARAPTTSDVFNAIAEPQRRDILDLLATGERSVNDIAEALDMQQPQTSKHLRVLRAVELVAVRSEGKQRVYRLQGEALKPVHEWVSQFERTWQERFDRLDAYLQTLQSQQPSQQSIEENTDERER